MPPIDLEAMAAKREQLRQRYLRPADTRPPTAAQGVHHVALLSSDVERTIRFYQEVLEFPLTDLFENRDYRGSTHFFFDLGNGNALAFFDFPDLELGPYREVLGGLHHLAIAVSHAHWLRVKARLEAAGIEYLDVGGRSLYFRDPDGTRLELICEPLGEINGRRVV